MKYILSGLLIISSSIFTFSKAGNDKLTFGKAVKMAEKATDAGDIYQAADYYEEALKLNSSNKDAAYHLGLIYYQMRDYKNAEKYFEVAASGTTIVNSQPLAAYYLALMKKMNGKYEDAKKAFEDAKKRIKSDVPGFDKKWIDKEIEGCTMAINKTNVIKNVTVNHPGRELNTNYADQAPVRWDSTTLVYATIESDTVLLRGKNNHFLHFYQANMPGITASSHGPFDGIKKVDGLHQTNGAFSPDHKRFYFNQCNESKDMQYTCAIYVSTFKDGKWSEAVRLPDNINTPNYTATQPCIGYYKEKQEVLYFVSDRPGGKGGKDIWYSTLDRSGNYGEPKNCGKLNSSRDDETPWYDVNTNTLYFSSTGQKSFGGFDIFSTNGSLSSWSPPENIGSPINGPTDDKYFHLESGASTGFFVSNRPGTFSIKSETCCPDIFTFEYVNIITVAVKGKVYEKFDNGTSKQINDVKVVISQVDEDNNNEMVAFYNQTLQDNAPYFSPLKLNKQYKVTASKPGYLASSALFTTENITKTDTLIKDLYLSKIDPNKAYRLNNIYYDFDKSNLRDLSKKTLDSLYNIMMENPNIIVELGSHTDSRGSDEYNRDLSQKRAESCVNYLIEKGIPKERISPKGYGESKPLEDCSKHPECPTGSQGDCDCHQLNRRTEFKIVGELKGTLIQENK